MVVGLAMASDCIRGPRELPDAAIREARLKLTAQGEHDYHVYLGHISIERDVTARAAANHQLAQVVLDRSPDHRVVLESIDRLDDLADSSPWVGDVVFRQMIQDAVDIDADFRGQLDSRHAQRASLRAAGRRAVLPASRAFMYVRISCHGIVRPEETTSA